LANGAAAVDGLLEVHLLSPFHSIAVVVDHTTNSSLNASIDHDQGRMLEPRRSHCLAPLTLINTARLPVRYMKSQP
jgi:hypothetical protein